MIVIHVGLKKCGSGSMQYFLSENCEKLRQISLEYPTVGRRKKSGGFYQGHHNFAHEIQRTKKFAARKGTLTECTQLWSRSDCRVMVLSSEMFEEAEVHEAVEMREILLRARCSEEFRIYVVIRDLIGLMPSSYAQKVRYGLWNYDFDNFFSDRMEERRVNFFDTVQRWTTAFGWENLELRLLDGANLLNGDLIDDFLAVCGITSEFDKRGLSRTGIQNSSPGWRVLEAIRALSVPPGEFRPAHPLRQKIKANFGRIGFGKLLDKCAETAGGARGWNSDRGRYLTRAQAQLCHETYLDAVMRMNEKLGRPLPLPADLDERGFCEREFLPDASHIEQRDLSAFYDDVWDLLRDSARDSNSSLVDAGNELLWRKRHMPSVGSGEGERDHGASAVKPE